MKRKVFSIATVLLLFFSFTPLQSFACGGFVAKRNERIFHSVYCDDILDAEYNSLVWFNTAKDAEVWSYTMCENCSQWHDYDFDNSYCEYYFDTSDPLLLTVLELSLSYGYESGRAREGEEHSYYYEQGYDEGYEDGLYQGRAEREYEIQKERKAEKEAKSQSWDGAFAAIVLVLSAAYVFTLLDNKRKK